VNGDARLIFLGLCCLVASISLGRYGAHRPLAPFDVELNVLRGRGTPLAVMFTRSGYWPALTSLGVVLFAADYIISGGIAFALVLSGTQLFSQWAAERVKDTFKRIRPDDWIYHQELGFSFPSGHATTAIVFFGGLLFFVWSLPLPREAQLTVSAVLAIFAAGLPWSRMVLSAHYGTDVLGGMLFGGAWLCLMLVLLRHVHAQPEWRLL
jgi:membrane-associated phospholipid phosphatase